MREFGLSNFAENISDSRKLTDKDAELEAYGVYLIHNGNDPDGFKNMTRDDVQIMYTTEIGLRRQQTNDMLEGLVTILSKMFGGR